MTQSMSVWHCFFDCLFRGLIMDMSLKGTSVEPDTEDIVNCYGTGVNTGFEQLIAAHTHTQRCVPWHQGELVAQCHTDRLTPECVCMGVCASPCVRTYCVCVCVCVCVTQHRSHRQTSSTVPSLPLGRPHCYTTLLKRLWTRQSHSHNSSAMRV